MSLKTKLLELFKYEPDKDGAQTFNIKSALNDNWDKIEAWAQSVKTALAKLVPTSRKVNGKALSADVTLTAADIKMPDSEEDVGAAMAKRLKVETPNPVPDMNNLANSTLIDMVFDPNIDQSGWHTPKGMQGVKEDSWYTILTLGTADTRRTQIAALPYCFQREVYIRYRHDASYSEWFKFAMCTSPEVHALPLTEGWDTFGGTCCYYKTQENVVTVSIRAKHNSSFTGVSRELICNLPVGFRPSDWVSGACALDIGDSGGSSHGGIHVDATGGVYINGFATYATVYAQISFIAAS